MNPNHDERGRFTPPQEVPAYEYASNVRDELLAFRAELDSVDCPASFLIRCGDDDYNERLKPWRLFDPRMTGRRAGGLFVVGVTIGVALWCLLAVP